MPLLNLLHQRLEAAHRLDLAALFDGQRNHDQPHQQRERDYGNSKIRKQPSVQQYQPVYHGLNDDQIPYFYYEFQELPLSSMPSCGRADADRLRQLRRPILRLGFPET